MDPRRAYDLTTVHTRELLRLLDKTRACGGKYDVTDNHEYVMVTADALKAELAKREHVPNKQEARAARQARAKRQRNYGR